MHHHSDYLYPCNRPCSIWHPVLQPLSARSLSASVLAERLSHLQLCTCILSSLCPEITCPPEHLSLPAALPRSPPTPHPAYPELVFPLVHHCLLLGYFILTLLQAEAIKTLRHCFNLTGPHTWIFSFSVKQYTLDILHIYKWIPYNIFISLCWCHINLFECRHLFYCISTLYLPTHVHPKRI